MHVAQKSESIRQTPFNRNSSEAIPFFHDSERPSQCAVVMSLHVIVTLSLRCFNGWLKPLLPHSQKETVSSVQDRDPYLESLLTTLHRKK